MNVYKIVLTGGPGGGKSSILNEIKKRFTNYNTRVITVNETASIMGNDNLKPVECNNPFAFQDQVYLIQNAREDAADALAEFFGAENVIIVYDRGVLDNRAYLKPGQFEEILYNHQGNEMEILDKYDLVINLMTAAHLDGKYQKESNPIRSENPDEALELDKKTLDSWIFHRNLYNVEATDNFDDKVERVIDIVKENLDKTKKAPIKYPLGYYTDGVKWFIDNNDLKSIYVEDYYLINKEDKKVILSKRSLGEDVSYLYKELDLTKVNSLVDEHPLNELQAKQLLCLHPPKFRVEKNIYRFNYDNQIMELAKMKDMCVLEVINPAPNKEITLPDELFPLSSSKDNYIENEIAKRSRSKYLK